MEAGNELVLSIRGGRERHSRRDIDDVTMRVGDFLVRLTIKLAFASFDLRR